MSYFESRFSSIDQTTSKVGDTLYSYMRIKRNPLSFAFSKEFEHIIIMPNTEENINLVILIPSIEFLNSN